MEKQEVCTVSSMALLLTLRRYHAVFISKRFHFLYPCHYSSHFVQKSQLFYYKICWAHILKIIFKNIFYRHIEITLLCFFSFGILMAYQDFFYSKVLEEI